MERELSEVHAPDPGDLASAYFSQMDIPAFLDQFSRAMGR
jgi:hypothetical protein